MGSLDDLTIFIVNKVVKFLPGRVSWTFMAEGKEENMNLYLIQTKDIISLYH